MSYCSDNVDTRIGRRLPWYIVGNILLIPFGVLLFNPTNFALGIEEGKELEVNDEGETVFEPSLFYFLFFTSCVNIGQGAL